MVFVAECSLAKKRVGANHKPKKNFLGWHRKVRDRSFDILLGC